MTLPRPAADHRRARGPGTGGPRRRQDPRTALHRESKAQNGADVFELQALKREASGSFSAFAWGKTEAVEHSPASPARPPGWMRSTSTATV